MYCFIYVRVSTDRQADKGLSIPAQLDACRQFAHQRNWTISEEFVEAGTSAKTTERPALQQLLTKCRNNELSGGGVLLVHKIDRLARNIADHVAIRATLQQHQIRLASVSENLEDSASGQLVEHIMAAIAEFYSMNLADEVRKGMRQKVLRGGWPHQAPRG
jgi:DNA invertase Pin-like site-specific DNA recombinase